MEMGLQQYIDYKVKTVQTIKGSYGFRIILMYPDRKKTQQRAGFSSLREAEEERCITIAELRKRTYLVYGNVLAKEYFIHWLDDILQKRAKASSYYSYSNVINNHILPVIGNKRMRELNTADIVRLYSRVWDNSHSVAKQVKAIMNSCLKDAIDEKAVATNVADGVALPEGDSTTPYHARVINRDKTLKYEQVLKLIVGSKGTPIHLMILFNVIMGLRCSEIIGLKYSDVDFIHQKLYVTRQLGRDKNKPKDMCDPKTYTKQEISLKTQSSERELDIPDIVLDAILKEKKLYEAHKSRRKREFQDLGYIVCSTYGRPRSRCYHFKIYKDLLKELGLPDIRWHDLRSTATTILLAAGYSLKAVSKMMGHNKEIVTADVYGDNSKLTVEKLDKLEEYISDLNLDAEQSNENEQNVGILDVSEYFE